jgi:hypothetical protein
MHPSGAAHSRSTDWPWRKGAFVRVPSRQRAGLRFLCKPDSPRSSYALPRRTCRMRLHLVLQRQPNRSLRHAQPTNQCVPRGTPFVIAAKHQAPSFCHTPRCPSVDQSILDERLLRRRFRSPLWRTECGAEHLTILAEEARKADGEIHVERVYPAIFWAPRSG